MIEPIPTFTPYPDTPDVPALRKLLDVIELHTVDKVTVPTVTDRLDMGDERIAVWDQTTWRGVWWHEEEVCGTAMCLAGWCAQVDPDVAWLDALGADRAQSDLLVRRDGSPFILPSATTGSYVMATMRAEDYARARLGLDPMQAERLFSANNTLEQLREMVEELDADPASDLWYWAENPEEDDSYDDTCDIDDSEDDE